jgi:hypothetical protein
MEIFNKEIKHEKEIWSSLLQISTQEDSKEIYFAFSEFYTIYYEFLQFIRISRILNQKTKFRKLINSELCVGQNRPEAAAHEVQRPVTHGGQQGCIGLSPADPVRCQSGLAG